MRWERQPDEPLGPWAAFQNFLHALPKPRRLDDLERIHGDIPREILDFWAERFAWHDRADAWDDHLDRIRVEAFEGEIVTMARRQAQLAWSIQEMASVDLGRMKKAQRRLGDAPLLNPRDVLRYAEVGMAQERAAAGIPEGAAPAAAAAIDFSALTPEERAQLRDLLERAAPRKAG